MWIQPFLDYLRFERVYSEHTAVAYAEDIRQFCEYLGENEETFDPAAVQSLQIRDWIVSLMDLGYTATSVNRKLSSLRAFYKYLMRLGEIEVDPLSKVKGPKQKKKLPVFVKEKEMNRLLDDVEFADDFKGCQEHLILLTFYSTGVRLSELIGMNFSDIDFSMRTVKVLGKRNKERIIPIGEELLNAFKVYLEKGRALGVFSSGALFVNDKDERLKAGYIYDVVKRNLSKVVTLKKRSPHVLRHTFATMMLNNGADLSAIKECLGHSSLEATEVYTHTTFEELKNIYKHAHPRA